MNELMKPEVVEVSVVEKITRGEIDLQVRTAKQYPRSIERFEQTARTLALADADTAKACFYVLPRGGKKIEGPSVRLAEIVASSWQNLRCQSMVIDRGSTTVTARAIIHDLETNVAMSADVSRRITDKNGRRYSDDMITMTENAAASIALRNAIFKVVPFARVKAIYDDCQKTAMGGKGIEQAKREWIAFYEKRGVTVEQILDLLEKPSVADLGVGDITTLQGINTAIEDGSTTLAEVFGESREPPKNGKHGFGFGKKKQEAKAKQEAKPDPKPEPKAKKQSPPPADDEPPFPYDPKTGEVLDQVPPPNGNDQLEF